MTQFEFRDCPFNGPRIEFVDFKRVHAIEGQSNSPIGEVSVAATGRPRLDRTVVARPSTGYKHPLRPQCDAIAAWLTPARNRMILIHNK